MAKRGTPALVLCHISHLYSTGCSLYYTIFARQEEGREIAQWKALKTAASDAIIAGGGTITHHHATGRDHAPWIPEVRPVSCGCGCCARRRPKRIRWGIMNPGKLMNGPDQL